MDTVAVVLEAPERLAVAPLTLASLTDADVLVDVAFSGISTGTERLLWSGRMPPFPGMGYPLVPGYEAVGRVAVAGPHSGLAVGQTVFVPGAKCFGEVRGLFGAAASRLVVPGARALPLASDWGERGVLLALAATAQHALSGGLPDLIVGHGVLGRLLARLAVAAGGQPVVWENHGGRTNGAAGYCVTQADADPRRDYARIIDASGDPALLDTLISRLAAGGEIVLAGFYSERLAFAFPPAFMREARLRVAAQWAPADLIAVRDLVESGRVCLDGLITHHSAPADAGSAYATAFDDPACLKMILDWSQPA